MGGSQPLPLSRSAVWRARHPDRLRAQQAAYRAAHPEELRARKAIYRAAHQAENIAYQQGYRSAHQAERAVSAAAYRAANRQQRAASGVIYRAAHREELASRRLTQREMRQGYTAKRRGAPRCIHLACEILDPVFLAWQVNPHRCYLCNRPLAVSSWTDHVVPIARGGVHCAENLRPCCRACNQRKGTRLLSELVA